MKSIKLLLLIIISITVYSTIYAQDDYYDDNNLVKYWSYRHRLVNYFVAVGPGPGESLVFEIRNKAFADTSSNEQKGLKELESGQTNIALGKYIGVLATEYKLLSDDNYSTIDSTLKELFYAIHAFNRLDLFAETTSDYTNHSPELNGFVIRNDAPIDFVDKHPLLNKNINIPNQFKVGSGEVFEVDSSNTSGQGCDFSDSLGVMYEFNPASQDELYGILLGMALVVRCLDDQVTFKNKMFQSGNSSIRREAKAIINRIINFLYNFPLWIAQDPDGNFIGNCESPYDEKLPTIFTNTTTARFFSYPLSKIGSMYAGSKYIVFPSMKSAWNVAGTLTADFLPIISQKVPGFDQTTNQHMALELAALCNCWYHGAGSAQVINVTQKNILRHSEMHKWQPLYWSLGKFLNNWKVNFFDQELTVQHLNSGPCNGPFWHNFDDVARDGWASNDRYRKTIDESNGDVPHTHQVGNYNGLDYMLVHNLYYLINKEKEGLPSFSNFLDKEHSIPYYPWIFPPVMVEVGSHNIPKEIKAMRSIAFRSKIKENGNITLVAGESIVLKPGFSVLAGGVFKAKITQLNCNNY